MIDKSSGRADYHALAEDTVELMRQLGIDSAVVADVAVIANTD